MASNAGDPASRIREALISVESLRAVARPHSPARGVQRIKVLQNLRFAGTYSDLLQDEAYKPAARFFLDELYGDRDYAERDAQFARIAGTLQTVFPQSVVATAVALAELHALTETLDHRMAAAWEAAEASGAPVSVRYLSAWRSVGCRSDRERQLKGVLWIGRELDRLTRKPGLRLMLRMMRGPAASAGLGALQRFLESGFDTFSAMARTQDGTGYFLRTIDNRESMLMAALFDAPFEDAAAALAASLPGEGSLP